MRSAAPADMSCLAQLAQSLDPDLRPVILKLRTAAFVSSRSWLSVDGASYEALALGLLPLVTSDVVADVRALLRGCPHAPASVLDLIRSRLGPPGRDSDLRDAEARRLSPTRLAELVATDQPATDLAIAANGDVVLDGRTLHVLVGRARTAPALAARLLGRSDLGVFDRAGLYRFDDRDGRARTRAAVAATGIHPRMAGGSDPARIAAILARSDDHDLGGLLSVVRDALGLSDALELRLGHEGERELFALALRGIGIVPDLCLRIFLTVEPRMARSVAWIAHLAALAREVAEGPARLIVAAGTDASAALGADGPRQTSGRSRQARRRLDVGSPSAAVGSIRRIEA